jgi:hypothetical protein
MEKVASLVAGILAIATIAVLVQSSYTSSVITATGNAFTGALKASMGQVTK